MTVAVLSCRRLALLERTIAAARTHFEEVEPDLQPRWLCFDNGSSPEDQRRLETLGFDELILSGENLGQGPGLNRLFARIDTPYFLHLEDDWVVENTKRVPFVAESIAILKKEPRIGQVKLDALHDTDFRDRRLYDGPFMARGVDYYVQNPDSTWGGFCCPPAITRTSALRETGSFREDQPFRRWWAESEFCRRFAQRHFACKSPALLIFNHIGDVPSSGWEDAGRSTNEALETGVRFDPYGTHSPVLAAACARSDGPILELGCGLYSTPMLHEVARVTGRRVVTVESDARWLDSFRPLHEPWHELIWAGADWDRCARIDEEEWGVAFVDHRPAERRRVEIARLRDRAQFLVVHDTEDPLYAYEPLLSTFRWRYDFKRLRPWTTVVSNTTPFEPANRQPKQSSTPRV